MHREVPRKAAVRYGSYALLPFDHFSVDELTERARQVVPDGRLRPSGKNQMRYLSYLAGRAAVGLLFRAFGLRFTVVPDPQWGYLTVIDETGVLQKDVFVNISHTVGVAAAALMSKPVGIDVERAERSAQKVMKRMATAKEIAKLPGEVILPGGEVVPSGILMWSAKEAVSKATGLGIKFGMKNFQIGLEGSLPFEVQIDVEGPLKLRSPVLQITTARNKRSTASVRMMIA
jgi:hypothetical protein